MIANLTHHLLVAMPAMADPHFSRTVTYIAEHNEQGALGVIINRPIKLKLGKLFERVDLALDNLELAAQPVFFGGPVQTDRGFVLHSPVGDWHSTLRVNDDIALTSSRDILQSLASGGEPSRMIVALGYAGWAAGQLEQELIDNAWLTVPADMSIVFDTPPESRFVAAMQKLGIDPTHLSETAGHA